ncbi:J domain-containing protein [Bacillus sp. NP157]|nr:J domain-containing protein [Bacillus sp. NP157]
MAADETDFLDLYGKLRLQPDCSLADFKQAYRRHVSQWHPDRRSRGPRADALAARRLQRLMAQYSAAMSFHKQHGRLPGAARVNPPRANVVPLVPSAAVAAGPCDDVVEREDDDTGVPAGDDVSYVDASTGFAASVASVPSEAAAQDDASTELVVFVTPPSTAGHRSVPHATAHVSDRPESSRASVDSPGFPTRRIFLLASIVIAGVLVWTLIPDPDRIDPENENLPVVALERPAHAVASAMLSVGMKDDDVVAVEGEPTLRGADRWEYGPSWVQFEGGSVVDWYSSPLRTLHTSSAHAPR